MLRIATTEPGRRPEFYRLLIESDVYVLTTQRPPGNNNVPADSDLAIVEFECEDGTSIVPFFSSLAMARHGAPGEKAAVIMRWRELFEMFPQRILLFNVKCPFARHFRPEEFERLWRVRHANRAHDFGLKSTSPQFRPLSSWRLKTCASGARPNSTIVSS